MDHSKILIVEDEPLIARVLGRSLRNLGYEVAGIVSSGERALEMAAQSKPRLVLMDIKLEGRMDGIEAASRIRSALNIPVVFLTAYGDDDVVQKAKIAEPFGFLVKPCKEKELHRAIEMAIYKSEAEQTLVAAKEEWERTFDAVSDSVVILDLDHRIIRANRATSKRLNAPMDQLVGAKCYKFFHGTESPPSFCPHSQLLSDGRPRIVEVCEPFLRGTFEVSVYPLFNNAGQLDGSVHVAHDITERKLNEEKQAELIEEIKHFAYIVSHDLRAPLTNLRGFANELEMAIQTIRNTVGESPEDLSSDRVAELKMTLDEDIPESLGFIKSALSRIDHLISAILRLSRIGHTELTVEPLDMNDLVEETVRSFAHQISQRGIRVSVGELPEIVADRTAMEQIVGNLLDNAVKYLDPSRMGEIKISGRPDGIQTVFEIADNGMGVESKDLERIFQVFQRSGIQDVPGEGMGLAYVKTLVRHHGGRIWCESEPGVGSVFTFTIAHQNIREDKTF